MERTDILHFTEVRNCYSRSLADYFHNTKSKFEIEVEVEVKVEVEVEVEVEVKDKLVHCIL